MGEIIELTEGWYTSRWGLTDLYEEAEEKLRELLASGKDFETEWCGSKKELLSAKYIADGDKIIIKVHQWMDDLYEETDLIEDAIYDLGIDDKWDISDTMIDSIRDECMFEEVEDEVVLETTVPRDTSYEDLMIKVVELENETDAILKENFGRLKEIVLDHYKYDADQGNEDNGSEAK